MEPKYYVPEISEFCIGFEFEIFECSGELEVFSSWQEHYIKSPNSNGWIWTWEKLNEKIKTEELRVKYLDTSDIESIIHENAKDYHTIFKLRSPYEDELVFQTYWVEENEFLDEEYIYWDIKYDQIKITHKSKTLFWGKIKNVSEFRKVLNMLDIK